MRFMGLAAIFLAATAMAQGPGAGGAMRQRLQPANLDALKQYLNLTDSQLEQLRTARREAVQSSRPEVQQMREKARALRQEMRSSNPDSAKVGQLTVELKQLREKIRSQHKGVAEKLRATLTAEQQSKLKALEEAQKLLPAIRQAVAVGLLEPPEAVPSAGPGPMMRRAPARRVGSRR